MGTGAEGAGLGGCGWRGGAEGAGGQCVTIQRMGHEAAVKAVTRLGGRLRTTPPAPGGTAHTGQQCLTIGGASAAGPASGRPGSSANVRGMQHGAAVNALPLLGRCLRTTPLAPGGTKHNGQHCLTIRWGQR